MRSTLITAAQVVGCDRRAGILTGCDTSPPYPSTLKALTVLVPDARPTHRGEMLRFLRRVPRDPFADPVLAADCRRGRLRSLHELEADQTRTPESHVYDVSFALDGHRHLNGVPLSSMVRIS